MGGTFDPPHIGHIVAAASVRYALRLQCVHVMPANLPWQKHGVRAVSSANDRLDMVRAAFSSVRGVTVDTLEIDRGGDTYTADTLESMAKSHPDADLYLVVGSDVAAQLNTWDRPDVVRSLARLVVYERSGAENQRPPEPWSFELIDLPLLEVSSTDIRDRVREGRPIDGLVPESVAEIIRDRSLYREDSA